MNEKLLFFLYKKTNSNELFKKIIVFAAKKTPAALFVIYISTGIYTLAANSQKLFLYLFVPFFTLILSTVLRKAVNKKRPFEVLNITPLISHRNGESFPSRHTVSAFIIAFAVLYINMDLGLFCFLLSFTVGITRIMTGVHYPSDVFFGAFISMVFGYFGYFFNR